MGHSWCERPISEISQLSVFCHLAEKGDTVWGMHELEGRGRSRSGFTPQTGLIEVSTNVVWTEVYCDEVLQDKS